MVTSIITSRRMVTVHLPDSHHFNIPFHFPAFHPAFTELKQTLILIDLLILQVDKDS